MNSPLCAPTLFRATAMDWPGDADLCPGIHLRVQFDPRFGFPLCPFVVLPLPAHAAVRPVPCTAYSTGGTRTPPFDIDGLGAVTLVLAPPRIGGADPFLSWVRLDMGGGATMRMELLDNRGRVIGRRSKAPWVASGTNIAQVRIEGSGHLGGVSGVDASNLVLEFTEGPPSLQLSLPVEDKQWYRGGIGRGAAIERATSCASKHLPPHDDPNRAAIPDPKVAEKKRLTAIDATLAQWVDLAYDTLDPPTRQRLQLDPLHPGEKGSSNFGGLAALLATAVDSGIARYLGLLGTMPAHLPAPSEPLIWAVWALMALDPLDVEGFALAQSTTFAPANIVERFHPEVRALELKAHQAGLATRAYVTVAAAAPALDPPVVPPLRAGKGRWNTTPRGTWTQEIDALGAPPTGPIAVVRMAPAVVSLHNQIEGTAPPRRAAMIAGRGPDGNVSITDLAVPAAAKWSVWYGDEFGRWGHQNSVSAVEPPRPRPAAPVVEAWFVPDPTPPTGSGPASAGTVRVNVVVPNIDALEPGMLPFTKLTLSVHGDAATHPPAPGSFDHAAPPTTPGGSVEILVTATLHNGTGASPEAKARLTVHDPRRPPPLVSAPALVWTSRPDPGGGAELALSWPVQRGVKFYRVYLADENALAQDVSLPEGASRAKRAKTLMAAAAGVSKARFQLVTDPPLEAKPNADTVHFTHRLPGRLTGLVFVRVLPVTNGWVEAPFPGSAIVPIAVPTVDRPPPPSLRVGVRPNGTTTLEIHASGIDKDVLNRLGGATATPEYRLRRTSTPAETGPEYAQFVTSGPLVATATQGEWRASFPVPAGVPFVRTAWYCEVRYPAEPGVDGHPDLVLTDRTVRPTWSKPGIPIESLWSEPSLPATTFHDPGAPAAPARARVERHGGQTTIVLDPAPVAHRLAEGPWRLAVWRLAPNSDPVLVVPLDQSAIKTTPYRLEDTAGASHYRLALIDPLGRWSKTADATSG